MSEAASTETMIVGLLSRLKESGEGAFNKVSEQLLDNPVFLDALRRTLDAKDQVNRTISGTLDFVNVPSKNDVARILEELEGLSASVSRTQSSIARIEQDVAVIKGLVERLTASSGRRQRHRV